MVVAVPQLNARRFVVLAIASVFTVGLLTPSVSAQFDDAVEIALEVAETVTTNTGLEGDGPGVSDNPSPGCPAANWDCPLVTPGAYVGEPTIHRTSDGQVFICGPYGVPSRSALWKLDPTTRHFFPLDPVPHAPLGGGDCDFQFDAMDRLYMIDLWLGGNSIATSSDHQTWDHSSPVTFKIPVGDRQWVDAAGDGTVYIMWRNLIDGIWVAKSTDQGRTFGLESLVTPTGTIGGNIVIDKAEAGFNTVYVAYGEDRVSVPVVGEVQSLIHDVYLAKTTNGGLTWTSERVHSDTTDISNIFPVVALDTAGNPYVVWGQKDAGGRYAIFESHRLKDDDVWSTPLRVNQDETSTNVFPWIIAGDPGRVGIAWYGRDGVGQPDDVGQDWFVHVAQSVNLHDASPTFTDVVIDQAKKNDFICTRGTLCLDPASLGSPGRELLDFLTIDVGLQGEMLVAYNSNVTDGAHIGDYQTRFTRQACGPSLYASIPSIEGNATCAPLAVPPPLPPTPLVGAYYMTGVAPVGTVDPLIVTNTLTTVEPTATVPKVVSNIDSRHGGNAGTIWDAHWFLDAGATGLSLTDTDVTVRVHVTGAGSGPTGSVPTRFAIYDANAASFVLVNTQLVEQIVNIPVSPTPTEFVVVFPDITATLTQGFEIFVDTAGAATGELDIFYDAALTPSRVEFGPASAGGGAEPADEGVQGLLEVASDPAASWALPLALGLAIAVPAGLRWSRRRA